MTFGDVVGFVSNHYCRAFVDNDDMAQCRTEAKNASMQQR